jgi:hypothetical protein
MEEIFIGIIVVVILAAKLLWLRDTLSGSLIGVKGILFSLLLSKSKKTEIRIKKVLIEYYGPVVYEIIAVKKNNDIFDVVIILKSQMDCDRFGITEKRETLKRMLCYNLLIKIDVFEIESIDYLNQVFNGELKNRREKLMNNH